jgi:hypothetical protein
MSVFGKSHASLSHAFLNQLKYEFLAKKLVRPRVKNRPLFGRSGWMVGNGKLPQIGTGKRRSRR